MNLAMDYANRMLDMAPRAVRNNKQALYRGFNMPPEIAHEWGNALEQNLAGMQGLDRGPDGLLREAPPELHRRVAASPPLDGGGSGNKAGASHGGARLFTSTACHEVASVLPGTPTSASPPTM